MSRDLQTKTRRSREDWLQLMAEYEAGDLTQRQFCAQRQLAYSTFCYWRKRLSADTAPASLAAPLIELAALPIYEPTDWRLELELGQGVVLRLK